MSSCYTSFLISFSRRAKRLLPQNLVDRIVQQSLLRSSHHILEKEQRKGAYKLRKISVQYIKYTSDILISILLFFCCSQRNTMSSIAPAPLQAKDEPVASVDIDVVMDNVSIVLFTLTVVLGITGNSLVIWVAGFKLKVQHVFAPQHR